MSLTADDLEDLAAWRRKLHAAPELSGEERSTAREVAAFLAPTEPDGVVGELGGEGVAVVYAGVAPGVRALARGELDALPVNEISDVAHRSTRATKAHLCGRDGYVAMLGRRRPRRGRAALLFPPAEETGAGAAAVIADPKFASVRSDLSFACHNLPREALGRVLRRRREISAATDARSRKASIIRGSGGALSVMAGLVPAIHVAPCGLALQNFDKFLHERPNKIGKPIRLHIDVDARDELGHDDAGH